MKISQKYIKIIIIAILLSDLFFYWRLNPARASDSCPDYFAQTGLSDCREIPERKKVVVAIIDDGVYLGHPELMDSIWLNSGEIEGNGRDDDENGFIDDRWGWNFAYNSNDMTTAGPHGTMIAGIIAANGRENREVRGIYPGAKLMPLIVADADGNINSEDIGRAIHYAVDNGAVIINISLGGDLYRYTTGLDEAVVYAFYHNVLIVAAAGNGDTEGGIGRNLDIAKISPVGNDNGANMVLGVGSVDHTNKRSVWSNFGSYVDIYAPGEGITTTVVPKFTADGDFYLTGDGTSFAAAVVTGVAALIKSKLENITNTGVRDRLISQADYAHGLKIINAAKALSAPLGETEKEIIAASMINKVVEPPEDINRYQTFMDRERRLAAEVDEKLAGKINGRILLQVEEQGQAWYVFPKNQKRYFLGRPEDALLVMKKLGLGVTHDFVEQYDVYPARVRGRIIIDVEDRGAAYYINPQDGRAYYLGEPSSALAVIKRLGTGISNENLRKIDLGELKL
jgi:hypothetical protein